MRLHYDDEDIRRLLPDGLAGLELESHRIDAAGHFAATGHPFPGSETIDRDYSETQMEINTPPLESPAKAVAFLRDQLARVQLRLKEQKEYLWPFSNPPAISGPEDIRVAEYFGELAYATEYREHLAVRYGKYKMTYSGIHFNYSFSDDLIGRNSEIEGADDYREYKDRFYLQLAEKVLKYTWVIVSLLAASPVLDNSFFEKGCEGKTVFSGYASPRCSETGYWNQFVPLLSYESIAGYVASINRYVEEGLLKEPRELYYPVRLKPRGKYSMQGLLDTGVDHIELRMIDLNPFAITGITAEDAEFLKLFLIWLACSDRQKLDYAQQAQAIQNARYSAAYDRRLAVITDAENGNRTLEESLINILDEIADSEFEYDRKDEIIEYQRKKLDKSYAQRVREEFGDDYLAGGIRLAKDNQEALLNV